MAVGQHGRMSAAAQEAQDEVLGAITPAVLAADVARMVRAASPTEAERPAVQELAAIAEEHALPARIDVHDLPALRGLAGCPGEVRLQGGSARWTIRSWRWCTLRPGSSARGSRR